MVLALFQAVIVRNSPLTYAALTVPGLIVSAMFTPSHLFDPPTRTPALGPSRVTSESKHRDTREAVNMVGYSNTSLS